MPAALVAGFVVAALISVVGWAPALPLLLLLYAGSLLLVGLMHTRLTLPSRLAFVGAVASMHLGYGIGTWQAILGGRWRR